MRGRTVRVWSPAEIRGGIEDQVAFVQLHHLGIIEPGGDRGGAQALLDIAQDLGPDIGG